MERHAYRIRSAPWVGIPRFDYNPSDRLRFILRGGNPHRATEWADIPQRPLEDWQTWKRPDSRDCAGKPRCSRPASTTPRHAA